MTETKRRARRLLGLLPFSYRGTLLAEAKRIRARRQAVRKKLKDGLATFQRQERHTKENTQKIRAELQELIATFINVTVARPGDRGRWLSMRVDMDPEMAMRFSPMATASHLSAMAREIGYYAQHEVEKAFRTLDFKRLDEYPRLPRPPRYAAIDPL